MRGANMGGAFFRRAPNHCQNRHIGRLPQRDQFRFTYDYAGLQFQKGQSFIQLVSWLGVKSNRKRACSVATLLSRTHDDILIAYFQDARIIDETRIQSLGDELAELATRPRYEKIILNFENVSFMSSSMIGKLILFAKKCNAAEIKLRFCNINENIEKLFELMNLGKVFEISKFEDKAIEAMEKDGWFKS